MQKQKSHIPIYRRRGPHPGDTIISPFRDCVAPPRPRRSPFSIMNLQVKFLGWRSQAPEVQRNVRSWVENCIDKAARMPAPERFTSMIASALSMRTGITSQTNRYHRYQTLVPAATIQSFPETKKTLPLDSSGIPKGDKKVARSLYYLKYSH